MYDWFRREISRIKTPKFHILESLPSDGLIAALPEELVQALPPSYLAFLSEFGSARLYRMRSYYLVGVHTPWRVMTKDTGEKYVEFGFSSRFGRAYFKSELLKPGAETPVYEFDSDDPDARMEYGSASFDKWLRRCSRREKKNYSKQEWQHIMAGPDPFTPAEQEMVRARRQYKWRVVGFSENGDAQIQIRNESNITLPYLSLGVIAKDSYFGGMTRIPVSHIKPGEEAIVERDCYKKWIPRDNLEVYDLPDPEPEDRAVYWEFRTSDETAT
jgi:hypothetical protein